MNPRFKIGQKVFHVLPESEVGVVVDITYTFSTGSYLYMVAFAVASGSLWYVEHELSDSKNYN